MTTKALVVLSGGQDSTLCAYWAKNNFDEVHAISFNYGQKHAVELIAAQRIASLARLDSHEIVNIPTGFLNATSQLTNGDYIERFADASDLPGGIAKTFVPMRNQMFLTIAANRAYNLDAEGIITGVCQTDSSGYPDCRQSFIWALEKSFNLGTFTGEDGVRGNIKIYTPVMNLTKKQEVDYAFQLGCGDDCYAAWAWSHTAYTGGLPTDGDAASLLRARGFEQAGIPDPLVLRLHKEGAIERLPDTANYSAEKVDKYRDSALKYADYFPSNLM